MYVTSNLFHQELVENPHLHPAPPVHTLPVHTLSLTHTQCLCNTLYTLPLPHVVHYLAKTAGLW